MKAAILIVGDDPALLETRADLLKAWQVSTTTCKHAAEEIRSKLYDLIIFCQTISDETVQTLINQARELNPTVKTLATHVSGQERDVDAELYEIQLQDPGRLLSVVARLLQPSSLSPAADEVVERT
jgi:DNA-binding response OmpR family regulator